MNYQPAKEVTANPDWTLLVTFENGAVKLYDAKQLLDDEPIGENGIDYRKLHDTDLFKTACVEEGGHFISWGDGEIGLNIEDVWWLGKTIKPPDSVEVWDELVKERENCQDEMWILANALASNVPEPPCVKYPNWTCQVIENAGVCPGRQGINEAKPDSTCWWFFAKAKRKAITGSMLQ